jgi:hypothetical protein
MNGSRRRTPSACRNSPTAAHGSKPYVSSGAYIDRMSDYCGTCAYRVKDKTGERACPFNLLYWHFLDRHRDRFAATRAWRRCTAPGTGCFRLLGFDVQYVFGFQGRGDGRLAFERGETNIDYQTSSAYIRNVVPLVEEGRRCR